MPMEKVCPRCGATFECMHDHYGCMWCTLCDKQKNNDKKSIDCQ